MVSNGVNKKWKSLPGLRKMGTFRGKLDICTRPEMFEPDLGSGVYSLGEKIGYHPCGGTERLLGGSTDRV